MKRYMFFVFMVLPTMTSSSLHAFDHQHEAWNSLLQKHVSWINNGVASQVDYAGIKKDQTQLDAYINKVKAVTQSEFNQWSKKNQLAFLINVYNAYTIEFILTKYPDIDSIKDLSSWGRSPWKRKMFMLFGEKLALDDIEHGMIRQKGVFDEPRIHFAVVCASIGCPALRNEAFTGDNIDNQLDDNLKKFLADTSRNRYNPLKNRMEVSKIFKWYEKDFTQGFNGFTSLISLFKRYADQLSKNPADQKRIQQADFDISYLSYDWNLNDKK